MWHLVTYIGFLLWCNILTYPDNNKVSIVYQRSSHKNRVVINIVLQEVQTMLAALINKVQKVFRCTIFPRMRKL